MAASQFTSYTSGDPGVPIFNGFTGSLINVLDYCLVSGSKWSKTLNSSSVAGHNVFAGYRPASGSRMYLFVNDAGGNAPAGGGEAWICGWENLQGIGTPAGGNTTGSVGSGSGQFPLPSQALTTGHLVARKNAVGGYSLLERPWYLFADAYTMYMYIAGEGTGGPYWSFGFGDIYSLGGTADKYRCIIYGRDIEASTLVGSTNDNCDLLGSVATLVANASGQFMPRAWTGVGVSIFFTKLGNTSIVETPAATAVMEGFLRCPNPIDGSFYVCPLSVLELDTKVIRGRLRGLYHLGHASDGFYDGQTFQGMNDYAGKTFQIITHGPNLGHFCIEISDTVETN